MSARDDYAGVHVHTSALDEIDRLRAEIDRLRADNERLGRILDDLPVDIDDLDPT